MLPGPCAPPLEAPSVPYQILTHFSCRLPTRRIIKSLASPLIFKRKSPRLERPAQPGTSGLRVSPAGLRTQRGVAGRRGKGAAPGDEDLRVGGGGAQAPPHPMCCRSSGRRGRVTPLAPSPAERTATNGGARSRLRRREGREAEARGKAAGEASSPRPRALLSPGAAAHPRAHAAPHSTWPFVCAHELAHAPSARSRRSRRTRRPGRTRNRRAPVAAGAAWAGAQAATRGAGAGAQAFTCAGQGSGRGEGQERQQQPHPAPERRRRRAGGRTPRRPPWVLRPSGRGFIAEPRREGARIHGTRVAAPPPGGASPPLVLKPPTPHPHPALRKRHPHRFCVLSSQRSAPPTPYPPHPVPHRPWFGIRVAASQGA